MSSIGSPRSETTWSNEFMVNSQRSCSFVEQRSNHNVISLGKKNGSVFDVVNDEIYGGDEQECVGKVGDGGIGLFKQ